MEGLADVASAVMLIAVLVLAAKGVRKKIPLWNRFYVPTSVLAGLLALCLGPQVAGRLYPEGNYLSHGIFPARVMDVWEHMPGVLAAFVFAGVFIGRPLTSREEAWRSGGPRAALGFTISLGQMALGLLVALLVLGPLSGFNPLGGLLVEISMSGGYATAAGLADTFKTLGFEEGRDFAQALATTGLIMSLVLGTFLVNRALRSNPGSVSRLEPAHGQEQYELSALQDNEGTRGKHEGDFVSDPLTLHLALFVVAMIFGQILRHLLIAVETYTYGRVTGEIVQHLPLFPMALLGGLLLQWLLKAMGREKHVSRESINRISGFLLDCIIVSGLATVSLAPFREHWASLLILMSVGILWTLFCLFVLAPRVFGDTRTESLVGDLGQAGCGAPSGLLLTHIADPENQGVSLEEFCGKQLLYATALGGGLVSALSMPLCARMGPVPLVILLCLATVVVTVIGRWKFGPSLKAGGV